MTSAMTSATMSEECWSRSFNELDRFKWWDPLGAHTSTRSLNNVLTIVYRQFLGRRCSSDAPSRCSTAGDSRMKRRNSGKMRRSLETRGVGG